MYRELITQLCTYVSAIRILAKGYLPNTLIKPEKLQEILTEIKKSLQITNPDYDLVLDRLHLYYDMQLENFSIDKKYESHYTIPSVYTTIHLETINSISTGDSSSYIALNSETYILFETAGVKTMQKNWL